MTGHTNAEHDAILDAHKGDNGLLFHRYRRCGFSGAGNCCCGRAIESALHPHEFRRSAADPDLCTCSKPRRHRAHRALAADPVPGSDQP